MGDSGSELARAKLTRRLSVVGRRSDGYHLLDAEMVSLDLADELTFGPGNGLRVHDEIAWERRPAGLRLGVPTDATNLVVRALAVSGGPALVELVKRIPPGAGLGGGSADAAAVLRWRGVCDPELAASLGADVPFCLRGGRAAVSGIGEQLRDLDYEPQTVVLVTPAFGVSTPAAYAAFDELLADGRIPPGLRNDLEPAALVVEARLGELRALFTSVAGEVPVLAGSGSTYFLECGETRATELVGELKGACQESAITALVRMATTTGPLGS